LIPHQRSNFSIHSLFYLLMLRILFFSLATIAIAAQMGCSTRYGQRISRNQKAYKQHPIAVRVHSKFIDEDSPIEYTLKFRNAGNEIVSFDYTVSDQPGIPHVDREGPNSGFISNLYPGAEIEVQNPRKLKRVWVTLGTVSYGKKPAAELDEIYRPKTSLVAQEVNALLPDATIPQP
jgi:hypothetical protein